MSHFEGVGSVVDKYIKLFENRCVRTVWDGEKEEWYFSVLDVVSVLTGQLDYRGVIKYWNATKTRLIEEGGQLSIKCRQLKMKARDGKMCLTDVANAEQILRIVQSIPSPKAEPFKLWFAAVGAERIDKSIGSELVIDRVFATYLRKGYTKEWINQRILALRVRNELTDELFRHRDNSVYSMADKVGVIGDRHEKI